MNDAVLLDVEDGIAAIRFNRPERLNALSLEVVRAFSDATERAISDPSVRVIVLSGEGRAFMAGGDLKHFHDARDRSRAADELIAPMHAALKRLADAPQISIGALHGPVAGAGMSIALNLDLAIAASSTVMHFAYSEVGASPDCGGSWGLPRLVGLRRAMQIALLANSISAEEALALGLVGRVVADEDLPSEIRSLAERLMRGSPTAQSATKRLMRQALQRSFADQLDAEATAFSECAVTEDFNLAVETFFNRGKTVPSQNA